MAGPQVPQLPVGILRLSRLGDPEAFHEPHPLAAQLVTAPHPHPSLQLGAGRGVAGGEQSGYYMSVRLCIHVLTCTFFLMVRR